MPIRGQLDFLCDLLFSKFPLLKVWHTECVCNERINFGSVLCPGIIGDCMLVILEVVSSVGPSLTHKVPIIPSYTTHFVFTTHSGRATSVLYRQARIIAISSAISLTK